MPIEQTIKMQIFHLLDINYACALILIYIGCSLTFILIMLSMKLINYFSHEIPKMIRSSLNFGIY